MAFRGSLPRHVATLICDLSREWDSSNVYAGCSGNFTIERALKSSQPERDWHFHSNDVTLYSSALGAYFSGSPFRLEFAQDNPIKWLEEFYENTPVRKTALVMLATAFISMLSTEGKYHPMSHYDRIMSAYKTDFPKMLQETEERLERNLFALEPQNRPQWEFLDSYTCADVVEWLETIPDDDPFIAYPPWSGIGAYKEYDSDDKKLSFIFSWDKPEFNLFTDETKLAFFHRVAEKQKHWVLGTNQPIEGFEKRLRSYSRLTNRGTIIYTYHSGKVKQVVTPTQNTADLLVPRLVVGEKIGSDITLSKLSHDQFSAVRSQYMTDRIDIAPASASLALAVLVDGKLVGVYAFSVAPSNAGFTAINRIYILNDLPVRPTNYPKLSKLVLISALSLESKLLAERVARRRITLGLTTAFTDNPSSMKYRGLFKVHSRTVNPDPTIFQKKYTINYIAPMGEWSLSEGLQIWLDKYGDYEE